MSPCPRCVVLSLVLLVALHRGAASGWAQESAATEVALAESAAPPHVAREATIYVSDRTGYTMARRGTNGFTCLVERTHPESVEPICYDAEGSETILPRVLTVAGLRANGADSAAIARAVAEGFATGRFRAPRRPGIAYMLSPSTRFYDPAAGRLEPGQPHLMFYAPFLRNADIGSPGEHGSAGDSATPFVIEEGTPNAYIVVLIPPARGAALQRGAGAAPTPAGRGS